MIDGIAGRAAPMMSPTERDDTLKQASSQLEGMFVQQLFKAMRETVPQQEGIVSGGTGEEMFTALMDQHLAAETPKQWGGGISEALYRQLRQGLASGPTADPPQASGPVSDSSSR